MVANNYAITLAIQGNVGEAIAIMEHLMSLFPGFDDTRVNLARLYIASNQLDEAETLIQYWDGQTTQALVNQVRAELQAAKLKIALPQ